MAKALGDVGGLEVEGSGKGRKMRTSEVLGELSKGLSGMNAGIGSIVSGITNLGIDLPAGIQELLGGFQSVISILSGISSAIMAFETIQSLPFFHGGGVVRAASGYHVPGNYGYDAVPAILTSGETVLTRAQAGNIASQLAERYNAGTTVQPYVQGENIYLGMNNTLKRMGRGEIVTTDMLRRMHVI